MELSSSLLPLHRGSAGLRHTYVMQTQRWSGQPSGTCSLVSQVPKVLVQLWRSPCCLGGDLTGNRSPNAMPSPSAGFSAFFPCPGHSQGEVFTCSRVTLCFYGLISLRKLIPKDVAGPGCLQATIPQTQPHCLA